MGWIRPDRILSRSDLAEYATWNFPDAIVHDSWNVANGLAPETKTSEERGSRVSLRCPITNRGHMRKQN